MENSLELIFLSHQGKVSDKWTSYISKYNDLFKKFKSEPINLLEIGFQNGGSLEIWAKYFEQAKLFVGCDIDEKCATLEFDDQRIITVIGDANSDATQHEITEISQSFDIIIDDGSHHSEDIIKSFLIYFPKLENNGIYIIEDLHASYWNDFGGGLSNPYSALSFMKRLIDVINFEHWNIEKQLFEYIDEYIRKFEIDVLTDSFRTIKSIEFLNSLCIISKSTLENCTLGNRMVIGNEEKITKNTKSLNNTAYQNNKGAYSEESYPDIFELLDKLNISEEKIIRLNDLMEKNKIKKAELVENIINLENEVLSYATSNSWKITRPMRKIRRHFKNQK